MLIHDELLLSIYFGNKQEAIVPARISELIEHKKEHDTSYFNVISQSPPFRDIFKQFPLQSLVILNQVHSNKGLFLASNKQAGAYKPRSYVGDYSITSLPGVALSVFTADCLPIIAYDTHTSSLGVAHAGWQGSVKKIGSVMIEHMMREFGTSLENLKIFFGPSAKVCCYKVTDSFRQNLESFSYRDQVLEKCKNELYFNLPLFNKLQLEELGVKTEAICMNYNTCTIESDLFCSYRKEPENLCRQLTIAVLR